MNKLTSMFGEGIKSVVTELCLSKIDDAKKAEESKRLIYKYVELEIENIYQSKDYHGNMDIKGLEQLLCSSVFVEKIKDCTTRPGSSEDDLVDFAYKKVCGNQKDKNDEDIVRKIVQACLRITKEYILYNSTDDTLILRKEILDAKDEIINKLEKENKKEKKENNIRIKLPVEFEEQIKRACKDWLTDAQNTGRMTNYADDISEGRIIKLPLISAMVGDSKKAGMGEKSLYNTLFDIEKGTTTNIMLCGVGGSGKTYMLFDLAEKILARDSFLDKDFQVASSILPIYIPLHDLNFNSIGSEMIMNYIYSKMQRYGAEQKAVEQFLAGKLKYQPLLLLDGYNEISSENISRAVIAEIGRLKRSYVSTRFIITGRYDFSSAFSASCDGAQNFLKREVLELSDKVIGEYLVESLNKNPNEIKRMLCNMKPTFLKAIRRPMALQMYVYTQRNLRQSVKLQFDAPERLGELLANYSEILLYTVCKNENILQNVKGLLAYIGFKMVVEGTFKITDKQFRMYINDYYTLEEKNKIDVDMSLIDKASHSSIIKKYTAVEITEKERKEIQNENGYFDNDMVFYKFGHQNFRDFFCAYYIKIGLSKIVEDSLYAKEYCEKYFPIRFNHEIMTLLGELTQDYSKAGKSLIDAVVRKLSHDQKSDYARQVTKQLIYAAKLSRDMNLSSFDFTGIDLSDISLNGTKLYRYEKECLITAKFDKAIVCDDTFAPTGHSAAVFAMCLIENRYLLSFSRHMIWCYDVDLSTYYQAGCFTGNQPITAIWCDFAEKQYIVTSEENKELTVWKYMFNDAGKIYIAKQYSMVFDHRINQMIAVKNRNVCIACEEGGKIYSIYLTADKIIANAVWRYSDTQEANNYSLWENNTYNCSISRKKGFLFIGCIRTVFCVKIDELIKNTNDSKVCIYNLKNYCDTGKYLIEDICAASEGVFVNIESPDESKICYIPYEEYNDSVNFLNPIWDESLDTKHTGEFKGYNRFSRSPEGHIFCCRNDQNEEKPNAFQLSIEDKMLVIIPYAMGKQVLSVITSVFLPSKRMLATCSADRSIQILDIEHDNLAIRFPGHYNGIHGICVLNENVIIAAQYSGEISFWHNEEDIWKCKHVYPIHSNWVWDVDTYTYNDTLYILTSSYDGTVAITNTKTEECIIREQFSMKICSTYVNKDDGSVFFNTEKEVTHMIVDYNEKTVIEKIILYKSSEGERIRDVCVFGKTIYIAANTENGDAKILIQNGSNSIDKIELKSDTYIKQFVARTIDVVHTNNSEVIIAVGGDAKSNGITKEFCNIYRIANHNVARIHTAIFNGVKSQRGVSKVSFKCIYNKLVLLLTSYSGEAYVIYPEQNNWCNDIKFHCGMFAETPNQILDIDVYNDVVYIATLDGIVYRIECFTDAFCEDMQSWDLEGIALNNSYYEKLNDSAIIRAISGFQMCGIDFSKATINGACKSSLSRYAKCASQNNTEDDFDEF